MAPLGREKPEPVSTQTVWAILDAYLDHAEANAAPATYEWHRYRLQLFKDALPNQPVHALKVYQVTDWIDKQAWSPTCKAGIITGDRRPQEDLHSGLAGAVVFQQAERGAAEDATNKRLAAGWNDGYLVQVLIKA